MINLYLERKVSLFGATSAFHQIDLANLKSHDRRIVCTGSVRLLPTKDDFGRYVLWVNHLGWNKNSQEATLRAVWCTTHELLKDDSAQRRGIVILMTSPSKFCLRKHYDRKTFNSILRNIRDVLPVKICAFHMILRNREMDLVLPYLLYSIGPVIRSRFIAHRGSCAQITESLARYGISRGLPATIDGDAKDDFLCSLHLSPLRQRSASRRSESL
jgi:hypothetical protein